MPPSSRSCPGWARRSLSGSSSTGRRTAPSPPWTGCWRSPASGRPPSRRSADGPRYDARGPAPAAGGDLRLGARRARHHRGHGAAVAGGAVLIALALTAVVLAGASTTGRSILAHLGIVVLAGALLFPALQRHSSTDEALVLAEQRGLVVELTVVAAADPAPPGSGPAWARGGQQMRARTVQGVARIGREEVTLPASLPVLVRASGESAHDLARVRDGDLAHVRGRVAVSGTLVVLRAT